MTQLTAFSALIFLCYTLAISFVSGTWDHFIKKNKIKKTNPKDDRSFSFGVYKK